MVTAEELDLVRLIVHKIVIPCIFAVGLVGNTLSIIVLTRKRMRCSTHVYLTGLAVTDLLYLVMCFIMSLKHYDVIHTHKMYWSLMGLFHWLIDSFSYISIYIVVSFTIERYIAVCHPIRGQSICTEARARKVIGIISIIVMISILTTAFEYRLRADDCYKDKVTGLLCSNNGTAASRVITPFHKSHIQKQGGGGDRSSRFIKDENEEEHKIHLLRNEAVVETNDTITNDCIKVICYSYETSELSRNPNYNIFYIITSIVYAGIPMILLITFNTFLILAVKKSNKLRKDMTNNINSRHLKQKIYSMTQENKITITLIAVVILFIVCQLPWACMSIADIFTDFDDNFEKLLSNIANLLVAVNAAANFFLYCLLSDKYRRTVKELITGHHYRRQDTLSSSLGSSWYKQSWRQNTGNESQRSKLSVQNSPIKDSKQPTFFRPIKSDTEIHRKPSIIQEELIQETPHNNGNNNVNGHHFPFSDKSICTANNGNNHRPYFINKQQFETSCPEPTNNNQKEFPVIFTLNEPSSVDCHSTENPEKVNQTLEEEQRENPLRFEQFLKPSGSDHCLIRSHSLDTPTKIKHSPDCKDYPYQF